MNQEERELFIAALSGSPNVSAACRAAGVGRTTVYTLRAADPDFASAWDDALEQSTDHLVGEAYRRAFQGTDRPVFYQGEECGAVREYSDTLTCFLLKAHRPAVYGEKLKAELSGANGGPLTERVVIYLPDNGRDHDHASDPSPETPAGAARGVPPDAG